MRQMWAKWSEQKPDVGTAFIVAAEDGCSTLSGIVLDGSGKGDAAFVDAECGSEISKEFLKGAIWTPLPEDYQIRFMNIED